MEKEQNVATKTANDEIDLVELIRHLWEGRKLILKITGAFMLFSFDNCNYKTRIVSCRSPFVA